MTGSRRRRFDLRFHDIDSLSVSAPHRTGQRNELTKRERDMNRVLRNSANPPGLSTDAIMAAGCPHFSYLRLFLAVGLVLGLFVTTAMHEASASTDEDRRTVSALDSEYQAAVKRNDVATMARILADDFVLVTGSGKTYTKTAMLEEAQRGDVYQQNDEENQTVRVWGDTAVVTAKLWEKYTSNGKSYDHKFWFSDTYVRTTAGWRYVFGQSSLPLQTSAQ
jgi:ketosteroid isomerase-like protein